MTFNEMISVSMFCFEKEKRGEHVQLSRGVVHLLWLSLIEAAAQFAANTAFSPPSAAGGSSS